MTRSVCARGPYPALALALVLGMALPACIDEDRPCGDWIYRDGFCLKPVDAPVESEAGTDGSVSDQALPTGFGDVCSGAADCAGQAGYCAISPSGSFCTARDCDPSQDTCPGGWKCWDAPTAMPGMALPTMCLPPDLWAKSPH